MPMRSSQRPARATWRTRSCAWSAARRTTLRRAEGTAMNAHLSLRRTLAVFIKEFQQMLRDRLTFAMAVGVPVLQLLLFGYAINTDPKGLPTVLVAADNGPLVRSFIASLQNTGYFRITETAASEREGEALIERGQAQFMVAIPPQFSRALLRGERPALLVAVD